MKNISGQIEFLLELEKLKVVSRFNRVIGGARAENSAEHSWHLAMMAVLLIDHSGIDGVDLLKVLKMLLIHDIVEIDNGDVFLYDEAQREHAVSAEQLAAERIFGILPQEQAGELMALWQEFEARTSPEARFAASLDALQPLMNHLITCEPNVNAAQLTRTKVLAKKAFIQDISPALWEVATHFIDRSVEKGLYHDC